MGEMLVKNDRDCQSHGMAPMYARVIKSVLKSDSDFETQEPTLFQIFDKAINKQGFTLDSLRASAIVYRMDKLNDLDSVISRHIHNLRHLQKGLDAFDIKKRMLKRLDLEIDQIEQKNDALEHQSRKTPSQSK